MAGEQRRRLIRAPQRATRPPAPDEHLAAQVTAGLIANQTEAQIARAVGLPRKRVEEIIRSRRVQEELRRAYAQAGITPEQIAFHLHRVLTATKQVLTPDGAGGWTAREVMDWRAVVAAIALYQGIHDRLARLEADEETPADAEVEEVVAPAEKVGKSRAQLFALYHERLERGR